MANIRTSWIPILAWVKPWPILTEVLALHAASARESNAAEQLRFTLLLPDRLLLWWRREALESTFYTHKMFSITEACFPAGIRNARRRRKLGKHLSKSERVLQRGHLYVKGINKHHPPRQKAIKVWNILNIFYCTRTIFPFSSPSPLPASCCVSHSLRLLQLHHFLFLSSDMCQVLSMPVTGSGVNLYSWGSHWAVFISFRTAAEWATVAVN